MTGVSRETPEPPVEAAAVFGTALPRARRFAELLAGPAVERGLIGPREVPRLWERHLLNCAALAPVADEVLAGSGRLSSPTLAPRVVDLGSGAGLPGVVVALLRPTWQVVLLEPMLRRTTFLSEVVAELGLASASVLRGRADDPPVRRQLRETGPVDLVVARAVAPLDRLSGWALPLLAPGGSLLALKGENAASELTAAASTLHRLHSTGSRIWQLPGQASRVVQVVAAGLAEDAGPSKRPVGAPTDSAEGKAR
ncbi:MAG: 16S rRNA (guanine(527)-N(7))-methyltransferase RsmG [Actinomycetes bacterium]